MHRVWVALTAVLLAASPLSLVAATSRVAAAPAPAAAAEFTSPEAVLRWIYAYRSRPEPNLAPAAYRAISQLGALKDPEAAGVYVGFLAGLIAANPDKAERLIAKMFPFAVADEWVIIRAIAYSGHPKWKRLLERFASEMPQHAVMIERYSTGKLATLAQLSFEGDPGTWDKLRGYFTWKKEGPKNATLEASPEVIDTLWGVYYASGRFAPISRLVAMLPWSKDRDKVERLTIGSMAKFTLVSNATRDVQLLELLRAAVPAQPPTVAPILKDVIEAAVTVEVTRVRKEALAAIEELKRKGPGYKRDLSMWGQVGEGAVALGCIAAAAVGQIALGLPCVLGGAATSATLRYWEKQD
jgi:hypothetical protein